MNKKNDTIKNQNYLNYIAHACFDEWDFYFVVDISR